ncbi:MAG: hypothetical protein ACOC2N_02210 [Spirochaetota bacterium]
MRFCEPEASDEPREAHPAGVAALIVGQAQRSEVCERVVGEVEKEGDDHRDRDGAGDIPTRLRREERHESSGVGVGDQFMEGLNPVWATTW